MKPLWRQALQEISLCCTPSTGAVRDTKNQAFLWQHTVKNESDAQCSSSICPFGFLQLF